ncbi:hypothetical protein BP6252_01713 [Coleophoma cylindrospora]|uniref:Zn(2)-C6 fungal-type domain-containing protein n=1 Tax=Coleophoma cylindrospora TaxID=1849047 RepID=A0A3D8SU27_9HELO|nr:hypothetical protein BP6252_01713 [Coleophoma cylindrospora]
MPSSEHAIQSPTASKAKHPPASRTFKHFIFTTEDDLFHADKPRRKRPRIKVACFACKGRKVKCTGRRPICEGCERNKLDCIYRDERSDEAPKEAVSHTEEVRRTPPETETATHQEMASNSHFSTASPVGTVQSPDFFSSLAEQFDAFNAAWPSEEVGGSSTINPPMMVSVRSPPTFHGRLPGMSDEARVSAKIRIPYFRWFGPTGIVPGFTKVLVDLRPAASPDSRMNESSPSSTSSPPYHTQGVANDPAEAFPSPSSTTHTSQVFDEDDDMVPKPDILEHLLNVFFDYFGCHFPFYSKDRFMDQARSKSVPAVLLNTMCALASRFSNHPDVRRNPIYLCGEPFGDKAKQLIFVLLSVPSYDLVASLLMLSWYEFGCNRDVGFWMYTGMAIRMAQDLGMHKEERVKSGRATRHGSISGDAEQAEINAELSREEEEETSLRLNLFWSIYFIDRIISLGTGRPLTLRDEQISCPLPSDGSFSFNKSIWPNPFPHLLQIMTVQGKVNEEISTIRQPADLTEAKITTLFSLQDEIIQIYTNLDPRLSFNVSNFQDYVMLGLGGTFLQLHVWFHAVIITLHRPGLMFGHGTLAHTLGKDSLEVSMSSANTITSILGLAELIDDKTIAGSPFLNQAIYIAGLAFIAELEMHHLEPSIEASVKSTSPHEDLQETSSSVSGQTSMTDRLDMDSVIPSTAADVPRPTPSSARPLYNFGTKAAAQDLLRFASKRNYETCLKAISTLKRYWRGIGWILSTMEQKAMGLARLDPSEESVDPESNIDLRDAGMLRRLIAVKNHRRKNKGSSSQFATEGWELGKSKGWGYGMAQNGFGIGETWVDLSWVNGTAPMATMSFEGRPDGRPSDSGAWTVP